MDNYKGFYKISERGGTYVTAVFYNPTTNEIFETCVRDYDYYDGSRDNDELYYMPINDEAMVACQHAYGHFVAGDKVIIARGRKMVGETKTVKEIYDFVPSACAGYKYKSKYATEYARFTDGTKCATKNCDYLGEAHEPVMVMYSDVEAR